jgi:dihydroorotase
MKVCRLCFWNLLICTNTNTNIIVLYTRQALLKAVTSGNRKFFIGTDSAPHFKERKEAMCGCAGIFTAHAAIELYAEAFDSVDALDKLEAFTSIYGQEFYNIPVNTKKIKLVKEEWTVPEKYSFGTGFVVPLRAGETIKWKLIQ